MFFLVSLKCYVDVQIYIFYFVDPVVMSCLVLMSCWTKTLNLGC